MPLIAVEVTDWTNVADEVREREVKLIFDTLEDAQAVFDGFRDDPARQDSQVGLLATFKYPPTPSGQHYTVTLKAALPSQEEGARQHPVAWEYSSVREDRELSRELTQSLEDSL